MLAFVLGAATVPMTIALVAWVLSGSPLLLEAVLARLPQPGAIREEAFNPEATVAKWESISIYEPDSQVRTMAEPVGKVTVTWDSGIQSNCTGTIIDERLVLTAAHCLRKPVSRVEESKEIVGISLIMAYDDPGDRDQPVTEDGKTRRFELLHPPVESVWSESIDYALLGTSPAEADPSSIWGIADLSPAPITAASGGWPLVVIHHPKKVTPKQITRYGCYTNGWRFPPDGEENPIGHNCDTIGGSSGAPLLLADDYSVVGVHRGAPGISRVGQIEEAPETPAIDKPLNLFSGIRDIAEASRRIRALLAAQDSSFEEDFPEVPIEIDYVANYEMLLEDEVEISPSLGRLGVMQVVANGYASGVCNGVYLGAGYVLTPLHCVESQDEIGLVFGALAARDILQASPEAEVGRLAASPWFDLDVGRVLESPVDEMDFVVVRSSRLDEEIDPFVGWIGPSLSIRANAPDLDERITLNYFGPSEDLRRHECQALPSSVPHRIEYDCDADSLPGSSGGLLLDADDRIVGIHQLGGFGAESTFGSGLLMSAFESQWRAASLAR